MSNPKFIESWERDKLIKELTTFTAADFAVMEEQAAEYLQHTTQRNRRKYASYLKILKIQLADSLLPVENSGLENPPRLPQQRPIPMEGALMLALISGIAAVGFLVVFMGGLWVSEQIVRAVVR